MAQIPEQDRKDLTKRVNSYTCKCGGSIVQKIIARAYGKDIPSVPACEKCGLAYLYKTNAPVKR